MIKTILVMLATATLCLLALSVMKTIHTPSCESLANEYLASDSVSDKEKILQHGIEIGCHFTK